MKIVVKVLTAAALVVGGYTVGAAVASQPDPTVTICHSETQTDCLWVDGTSEWR